jgi:hypothetical protein
MAKNQEKEMAVTAENQTDVKVEELTAQEPPVMEVIPLGVKEKLVPVVPAESFNVTIGSKRWRFIKDKEINVPKEVKEYLKLQGALKVQ